jgi:hypothetical protein
VDRFQESHAHIHGGLPPQRASLHSRRLPPECHDLRELSQAARLQQFGCPQGATLGCHQGRTRRFPPLLDSVLSNILTLHCNCNPHFLLSKIPIADASCAGTTSGFTRLPSHVSLGGSTVFSHDATTCAFAFQTPFPPPSGFRKGRFFYLFFYLLSHQIIWDEGAKTASGFISPSAWY